MALFVFREWSAFGGNPWMQAANKILVPACAEIFLRAVVAQAIALLHKFSHGINCSWQVSQTAAVVVCALDDEELMFGHGVCKFLRIADTHDVILGTMSGEGERQHF